MASTDRTEDRHAIPRLRSFAASIALGELSSLKPHAESPFTVEMLADLRGDWEFQPGVSVAADLVSTAIILGKEEAAHDAAQYILDDANAPVAARQLAGVCLGAVDPNEIAPGLKSVHSQVFSLDRLYEQIHRTRLQLHRYPGDPILWCNLAGLYISLGQASPARRAIRAATALAPQNRFVLRSAARILLHIDGKGGEARALLKKSDGLKADPWLLAADVSVSASSGQESEHLLLAQRLVEAEKFPPFDASELAAELATIFALDGNSWGGKKLLRRSMAVPCENALAQAAWLAQVPGMPAIPLNKTTSPEANSLLARQVGELDESLSETQKWLDDQPFSGRPATAGSFLASRIGQFDKGIEFAEQGLRCNPDHWTLHNNLAFSLAKKGDVQKAQAVLRRLERIAIPNDDVPVLVATRGLIAYRAGEIENGRNLYLDAIKALREKKDAREGVALVYYAMEELRAGTKQASAVRDVAMKTGREVLVRPEDVILLKQLAELGKPRTTAKPPPGLLRPR